MGALGVQAIRSLVEVRRLAREIDAVNRESRRPCPFSTAEYLETFVTHDEFDTRPDELLLLAAFEDGRLVGYLPLRKHRMKLGGLTFGRIGVLVSHDTDRPRVVARPEDEARCAQAFYRHLLEREPGWSLIDLAFQDDDSALNAVPAHSERRYWARQSPTMPVALLPVSWRTLGDFLARVDGKFRKTLLRALRRTLGAGRIEVVSSADPRAVGALLKLYLDLERRSWKQAARAGIGRDPRRIAFFEALTLASQPMRLAIHLVLLDGLPVAGAVTGAFEGVLHGLEMCFDQDYEALGCGHLGLLLSLRFAGRQGLREVNLNGNYTHNKIHFGARIAQTHAVQIFKVGSVPWLKAQAGRVKRWLRPEPGEVLVFNPERRAHEQHAATPPPRDAERAQAAEILAALEAQGVVLERLPGDALAAEAGLDTKKEVA